MFVFYCFQSLAMRSVPKGIACVAMADGGVGMS